MFRMNTFVFIFLIYVWETHATCGVCDATNHYRCTLYNQYQSCDASNNPVGNRLNCSTNTFCTGSVAICSSSVVPECTCGICVTPPSATSATIACVTDTHYAICNAGGDIIPDTAAISCAAGLICSSSGTPASPCVASTTADASQCAVGSGALNICPTVGRFPIENTLCKNYRLCTQLSNGTMTYYTYTCPGSSVFDPVPQTCSITYVCPP